jgi:hypothetical protein
MVSMYSKSYYRVLQFYGFPTFNEIIPVISKSVCGCEMCATDTWNMQLDTHASFAMYQV